MGEAAGGQAQPGAWHEEIRFAFDVNAVFRQLQRFPVFFALRDFGRIQRRRERFNNDVGFPADDFL